MGELRSALDALAAEDRTGMFGPQLLERLGPLLVLQNRVAAEIARTVRECELTGAAEIDGLKTMPSWLRGHAHLSAAEASRGRLLVPGETCWQVTQAQRLSLIQDAGPTVTSSEPSRSRNPCSQCMRSIMFANRVSWFVVVINRS